jgi:glucosamine-6-phosphate deaminase
MLDEWYGLDKTQEGSCYAFLQKYLVEPLQIPNERFFIYDSQTSSPEEACLRMQLRLKQEGPYRFNDIRNWSQWAPWFNEPNDFLSPACHVAELEGANQATYHDWRVVH